MKRRRSLSFSVLCSPIMARPLSGDFYSWDVPKKMEKTGIKRPILSIRNFANPYIKGRLVIPADGWSLLFWRNILLFFLLQSLYLPFKFSFHTELVIIFKTINAMSIWLFRVKSTIKFKFEQQQFTRGAPLIFSRAPKNYLCIFAQNSRMFIEPVSTKIALWTIRSRIASAWTPPPRRSNQSSFLYWLQKIVEASSWRRSISSKIKCCSSSEISSISHSSIIRRPYEPYFFRSRFAFPLICCVFCQE